MNPEQSQNTKQQPKPLKIIRFIAPILTILLVAYLWRGQARLKADYSDLATENSQLRKNLSEAESKLASFKTGNTNRSSQQKPAQQKPAKTETAKPTRAKEPETLILKTPTVSKKSGGLAVRLAFEQTTQDSLDLVALVVRIPNHSDARILEFKPTKKSAYTNVKSRVDQSGKFAIFQGTPNGPKALKFNLTVSESVTATIRGSKGIKPFIIDIDQTDATVREL